MASKRLRKKLAKEQKFTVKEKSRKSKFRGMSAKNRKKKVEESNVITFDLDTGEIEVTGPQIEEPEVITFDIDTGEVTIKEPKKDNIVIDFDFGTGKAEVTEIWDEKLLRDKEYLTDMLTNRMEDIDPEILDKVREKIYNASEEEIEGLLYLYGDTNDWKEFYMYNSENQAGYASKEDRLGRIVAVLDYFGETIY